MTEASIRALDHLRDLSTLKWYVIPLLAIVLYIYAVEMRKARASRNRDAVFAGLTLFGMDFLNETWNGWVLAVTGHSAFWTTPGDTALRTLVGWNIEIMFMFAIAGIVFCVLALKTSRAKVAAVGIIYAVPVLMNVSGMGILGWRYSKERPRASAAAVPTRPPPALPTRPSFRAGRCPGRSAAAWPGPPSCPCPPCCCGG